MIFINNPLLAVFLVICVFASCRTIDHKSGSKNPILSINDSPVYTDEFLYVFNKNKAAGQAVSEKEIDEYFDLFINFKLKVAEARSLGYQNTAAFITEFGTYKEELAKPYLTENVVSEQLVRQAYERMKEEVNASHLLILADVNTSPEDTLKAFERISELRQKIINGEDFNQTAAENSQDPSARMNGGNLGYFTALQMVFPFEEMAYSTPPGEISPVFKSRFGYHILKVHERRPSKGNIKVSHILIRATAGISTEDSLTAAKKIHEIQDQLKNGALWFDLCQQFSEDLSTKTTGGVLPWFGSGKMMPEFERSAFGLKDIGDISTPVKTAYGWHIIKLEDRKELEPFEEIAENIRNLVKKDSRSELSRKAFVEKLKKENQWAEKKDVVSVIWNVQEKHMAGSDTSYNNSMPVDKELFRIGGTPFQVKEFLDHVKSKRGTTRVSVQQFKSLYDDFVGEKLINYEKERLADKHFEYKMLLTEYEEGILLFQLMDERVWTKALEDTSGLRDYFERNIAKYQWGSRVKAAVYNASRESIRTTVKSLLGNDFIKIPSSTKTIGFGDQETSLSDSQREALKDVVSLLKKNPEWVVNLNFRFSETNQQRVESVMNFLSDNMVLKEQVRTARDEQLAPNQLEVNLATLSRKSIEKWFSHESELALKVEDGLFEKGDHAIVDITTWQEGIYEINAGNRFYIVEIIRAIPPGPKKLEDIRGLVISDYQNFLEEKWIQELKEKYPVTINEKQRKKIYSKLMAI